MKTSHQFQGADTRWRHQAASGAGSHRPRLSAAASVRSLTAGGGEGAVFFIPIPSRIEIELDGFAPAHDGAQRAPVTIVQGPAAARIAAMLDALALPPRKSAQTIRWPVQGCLVYLIEAGEVDDARVQETATALLVQGARAVNVFRRELVGYAYTQWFYPARRAAQWAA